VCADKEKLQSLHHENRFLHLPSLLGAHGNAATASLCSTYYRIAPATWNSNTNTTPNNLAMNSARGEKWTEKREEWPSCRYVYIDYGIYSFITGIFTNNTFVISAQRL
jgi:hypothetical protein